MSLSAADLALRKTGLSATDVVTLATSGDGGYGSPLDVFLSKTTDAPPWGGNMRTEMGHAAEPVIIGELAKRHKLGNLIPSPTVRSSLVPYFLATPDRILLDEENVPIATCEAKLVGYRMVPRWFDEEGVATFPDEVAIQVCWQMGVVRTAEGFARRRVDHGYVGALLGDIGEDAFHSTVMAWADVEEMWFGLQELAQRFWFDHVLAGVPPTPDGSDRAAEALQRMFPRFKKAVLATANEETSALLAKRLEVFARRKAAETELDVIDNRLKLAIGQADAQGITNGAIKATWLVQRGKVSASKMAESLGWSEAQLDDFRGAESRVLRVGALSKKETHYTSTVRELAPE